MVTEDSLSGMDHATFERFVFRYVSSIKRFILSSNPNAADPGYVLYSNIKDWGMNFNQGVKRQNLSLTIETLYRTGATISEIVSEAGARLQKEQSETSKFHYQWTTHRAFKHVTGLFAFRILSRALENPPFLASTIAKALPTPTHTMLDLLMMDSDSGDAISDSTNVLSAITSQFGRIEWNSTQPILGALLLTLKEKGYINSIPSYPLIKSVFTNAQSIDQSMRPGKEDGETQYEKIKANAFGLFKAIKPNPKLPNGKKNTL